MKRTCIIAVALTMLVGAGAARAADLSVWGLQAFNQQADAYIGELVKAFGKSKGVDAEYVVVPANVLNQRLAAAFEGNAPPDAFMQVSSAIQYYISRGLTVPLDEILAEMRKVPGGIFENHVPAGQFNGQAHSLPLEVDVVPVFARKDLLDEIGKPPPTTWEELREDARLIQAKHPNISGFGDTVSNSNDAEGAMRSVIWSFGGALMAADGKTVTFDSPQTRAAYQFIADMFLKDRTIPRAALTWDDAGNNQAYQTGRAAFVINPPSIYYWLQENDKQLLANTLMISVPKGPGAEGRVGAGTGSWQWAVSKGSKHQDLAKQWLSYFFQPERYQAVIDKVGGRWVPIYPAILDKDPLFAGNPAFADFKAMATGGIIDGYKGPPNALVGRVWDATIITKVLQKILVDNMAVSDAVAWGQQQIETLAKGG
ncbi:MAG: sugar ABC transporter substrate-binding protein [Proteobacteria bacterium]|nr:sugar ABC transporter substrate-binding protein [Pseudomonadota bacterium]